MASSLLPGLNPTEAQKRDKEREAIAKHHWEQLGDKISFKRLDEEDEEEKKRAEELAALAGDPLIQASISAPSSRWRFLKEDAIYEVLKEGEPVKDARGESLYIRIKNGEIHPMSSLGTLGSNEARDSIFLAYTVGLGVTNLQLSFPGVSVYDIKPIVILDYLKIALKHGVSLELHESVWERIKSLNQKEKDEIINLYRQAKEVAAIERQKEGNDPDVKNIRDKNDAKKIVPDLKAKQDALLQAGKGLSKVAKSKETTLDDIEEALKSVQAAGKKLQAVDQETKERIDSGLSKGVLVRYEEVLKETNKKLKQVTSALTAMGKALPPDAPDAPNALRVLHTTVTAEMTELATSVANTKAALDNAMRDIANPGDAFDRLNTNVENALRDLRATATTAVNAPTENFETAQNAFKDKIGAINKLFNEINHKATTLESVPASQEYLTQYKELIARASHEVDVRVRAVETAASRVANPSVGVQKARVDMRSQHDELKANMEMVSKNIDRKESRLERPATPSPS